MKAFMFAACPGARLWQKQRQGHGQSVSLPAVPPPPYTHLRLGSTSTALPSDHSSLQVSHDFIDAQVTVPLGIGGQNLPQEVGPEAP